MRSIIYPKWILVLLLPLCAFSAVAEKAANSNGGAKLRIGDPAPALKTFAWIKGAPTSRFKRGQLYVVDFWATWCEPCKKMIPHLSELAKKHAGAVTVIGVSTEMNAKATAKDVQRFVESWSDRMTYDVAMDDPVDRTLYKSWLKAAGVRGIPRVFLVDRDGRIAWIGYPSGLDEVLANAVNGTHDLAAARARYEAELKTLAAADRLNDVVEPLSVLNHEKKYAALLSEVEKAIAERPSLEGALLEWKLVALLYLREKEGIAYAASLLDNEKLLAYVIEQGYVETPDKDAMAGRLGGTIASNGGYSTEVYQLATAYLQQGTGKHPEDWKLWMSLAGAYERIGDFRRAAQAQEKVLVLYKEFTGSGKSFAGIEVAQLESKLREYQQAARIEH